MGHHPIQVYVRQHGRSSRQRVARPSAAATAEGTGQSTSSRNVSRREGGRRGGSRVRERGGGVKVPANGEA
jgi:hypothetical protein